MYMLYHMFMVGTNMRKLIKHCSCYNCRMICIGLNLFTVLITIDAMFYNRSGKLSEQCMKEFS